MKLLITLLAAFSLAGCATLREGGPAAKLAVQIAAMKVIEADGDRRAKAGKVLSVASELKTLIDMDGITLAQVKERAMQRVLQADLEASDYLLASALIDAVALELDARIGSGVLTGEHKTTVNAVLAWVADAARFY